MRVRLVFRTIGSFSGPIWVMFLFAARPRGSFVVLQAASRYRGLGNGTLRALKEYPEIEFRG